MYYVTTLNGIDVVEMHTLIFPILAEFFAPDSTTVYRFPSIHLMARILSSIFSLRKANKKYSEL